MDVLKMYSDYLTTQTRKISEKQQQLLPESHQEENASITTIDGVPGGISSIYCHFEEKLRNTLYMNLFLL